MTEPKVSIIVPVYNTEKYLNKCLESIIYQTYKNIEVIIVNDGSEDHSGDICDQYSKIDKRINLIHQLNKGLSEVRNLGLASATGEYIYFVDSDDFIDKSLVEKCINKAEIGRYDGVCFNMHICKKGQTYVKKKYSSDMSTLDIRARVALVDKCASSLSDKFYRKSILKNIVFKEGVLLEDSMSFPDVLKNNPLLCCLDDALYYYNVTNGNSIMHNLGDREDYYRFLVFYKWLVYSHQFWKEQERYFREKCEFYALNIQKINSTRNVLSHEEKGEIDCFLSNNI